MTSWQNSKQISIFTIIIILILVTFNNLYSQSLLVGIPSANTAHQGKLELTHESQFGIFDGSENFKWNSFNILCYGLTESTELTATYNNMNSYGSENTAFSIGAKHVMKMDFLKIDEKYDPRFTFGGNIMLSDKRWDVGPWIYSHLSAKIPATNTRLIGGVSYGYEQAFGFNRNFVNNSYSNVPIRPFSAIVGFEQPIVKDFTLIADWFSGNHELGALIVAGQYEYKGNVFIFGYKMQNNKNFGNNALILEFMLGLPKLW
jgi:hypothetical protein